ncbi:hypothetical protein APED_30240 [Acanthopleuribacter pedis]
MNNRFTVPKRWNFGEGVLFPAAATMVKKKRCCNI